MLVNTILPKLHLVGLLYIIVDCSLSFAASFSFYRDLPLSKFIKHLITAISFSFESIFFGSTCLCGKGFSQMEAIKSRYRSRLTERHLRYCLHLCLTDYGPSLSEIAKCAVSCINCRNRKVNEKRLLIIVDCRDTIIYTHTTLHALTICYTSLCTLTVPMPKTGDFKGLIK